MRINKLIDEFTSRNCEVIFTETDETGITSWHGHWFCLVNAASTTEKQQLDMAKSLIFLNHKQDFPANHFSADENTAAFLERIKGPVADLKEDLELVFAAKARLLDDK